MAEKRSLTEFQSLPDSVTDLFETLQLTPEQLEQIDWVYRDDWEPAEPCPNCGSTFHAEFFVECEFVRGGDGHYQFEAGGDRADTLGYVCGDCDTPLSVHPLLAVLWE